MTLKTASEIQQCNILLLPLRKKSAVFFLKVFVLSVKLEVGSRGPGELLWILQFLPCLTLYRQMTGKWQVQMRTLKIMNDDEKDEHQGYEFWKVTLYLLLQCAKYFSVHNSIWSSQWPSKVGNSLPVTYPKSSRKMAIKLKSILQSWSSSHDAMNVSVW